MPQWILLPVTFMGLVALYIMAQLIPRTTAWLLALICFIFFGNRLELVWGEGAQWYTLVSLFVIVVSGLVALILDGIWLSHAAERFSDEP